MQCYHRKNAWISPDGLVFSPKKVQPGWRHITVPCGKCAACRLNKSSEWATRVVHEMDYCSESCFLTLTYADAPEGYNLRKKDLQDFMKRLRVNLSRGVKGEHGQIRAFFSCGEYGSKRGRPHYHVLILGWQPHDLMYFKKSYGGDPIFTSDFCVSTWKHGYVYVGTCTNLSAGYVARYAKKVTGASTSRVPEFTLSSRNIELSNGKEGALGAQWYLDHHEMLRFGYVELPCVPGVKLRIPDYYYKLAERYHPDLYEAIKLYRYDVAMEMTSGISWSYNDKLDDFDLFFDSDARDDRDNLVAIERIRSVFALGPELSQDAVLGEWKARLRHAMVEQERKIEKMFQRRFDKSPENMVYSSQLKP